jgi:hypothetical protein
MSSGTKKTIIGVVVGIGGAAILGGLFIVAWRVWGRKRNTPDESDELMGTAYGHEKGTPAGTGSNPFQSTLESYHTPSHGVNASSNF